MQGNGSPFAFQSVNGFNGLTGDVTATAAGVSSYNSVVPMNKGGSNKNMTASAGAVVYSDADSLELTAVGTAGQVLISAGTGAPAFGTDVLGVATNSSAAAGYKGEFGSVSIQSGGATVSLTNGIASTVTSLSLAAGDYDVWAVLGISGSTAPITRIAGGISQTTNTQPAEPWLGGYSQYSFAPNAASNNSIVPVQMVRTLLSGTTTIYLVATCLFASGSVSAYGSIMWRRIR